jgi:hypothetical protein
MVLNFQMSQIRVSKFPNVSIKGNLLEFTVKSCQNSQNTYVFIFFKKKIMKIFKDSGTSIFANSVKF